MPHAHERCRDHGTPWRSHLTAKTIRAHLGKGVRLPEGEWTAETFARDGRSLITTLVRLSRYVQRKAMPAIYRIAAEIFERQLDRVIDKAMTRAGTRSAKAEVSFEVGGYEALWLQAIEEVMEEDRVSEWLQLVKPLQSVAAQAAARTGELMNIETSAAVLGRLAAEAREVAARITNIDETTRARFSTVIRRTIADNLSMGEIAAELRSSMTEFNRPRLNTIARTETAMAWHKGSVSTMQQSTTLQTVDVVGCEARERNSPQYRGESTCNIMAVPIHDAHLLTFHPNHTGVVVPSAFRSETGNDVDLGSGLEAVRPQV